MNKYLFLHGALGSKEQLAPLISNMGFNYEIHAINFSGHGGKPFNEQFCMEQFVDELEAYILENELEGVHVFGYSMGGYVALCLESKRNGLMGSITTLGTKFNWDKEQVAKEIKMLNASKIEEKIPQYANYLKELHAPIDWKEYMEKTIQMMQLLGENPILNEKTLSQIECNVNVLRGEKDEMVTLEESAWAANAMPNSKYHEIKNALHPINKLDTKHLEELVEVLKP